MPRDASGTYTLPEAPFQPATVAQSARVNHNFSDIAAALSDSYSVSLAPPMQGDLQMNGHQILGIGGDLAPTGNVTAGGNVTASGQILSVGSNTTQYPTLTINGAAGTDRRIISATAGNVRWIVAPGDGSPENGSNSGSNFAVVRYADNGTTALGTPLTISRATGVVSVTQTLAANGGVSTTTVSASGTVTAASASISGAVSTGNLTAASVTASGNVSAGGTLTATGSLTAASAAIVGNINAATLGLSGAVTAGAATVTGNITCGSLIQGWGLHAFLPSGRGGWVGSYQGDHSNVGFWNSNGTTYWGNADASDVPSGPRMRLDPAGNLVVMIGSVTSTTEVYAGGKGVYYSGIGGTHAIAFWWTGTQMDMYADNNYAGSIATKAFADEIVATAAVQTSRLDALEARIAALEAAQP